MGIVSIFVFAGLSVGLWRALHQADRQRERAVGTAAITLAAIDDILQQEDLPGSSDPEVQREAMINSVSRSLARLAEYAGDDKNLITRSSKAYLRRGRLLVDIANLDDAIKTYEQAVSLAQKQLELHPGDVVWRRELATAINRLGGVYDRKGDAKNATKFYQQAEEQRRTLVNETHAPDDEHDLAVTLYNRAGMDAELAGLPANAQKRFQESCDLLNKIAKASPDKFNYTDSLAQCWFNWAHFLGSDPNKLNQALAATKNAKELWSGLLKKANDSLLYQVKLSACLTELGKLHHLQQEHAEALVQYREALSVYRDMVKRHPKVATYHGMLGLTCSTANSINGQSAGSSLEVAARSGQRTH